jgi:hypothetical protein
MSSHEDEPAANDNIPISPPNVEVVSDTKYISCLACLLSNNLCKLIIVFSISDVVVFSDDVQKKIEIHGRNKKKEFVHFFSSFYYKYLYKIFY